MFTTIRAGSPRPPARPRTRRRRQASASRLLPQHEVPDSLVDTAARSRERRRPVPRWSSTGMSASRSPQIASTGHVIRPDRSGGVDSVRPDRLSRHTSAGRASASCTRSARYRSGTSRSTANQPTKSRAQAGEIGSTSASISSAKDGRPCRLHGGSRQEPGRRRAPEPGRPPAARRSRRWTTRRGRPTATRPRPGTPARRQRPRRGRSPPAACPTARGRAGPRPARATRRECIGHPVEAGEGLTPRVEQEDRRSRRGCPARGTPRRCRCRCRPCGGDAGRETSASDDDARASRIRWEGFLPAPLADQVAAALVVGRLHVPMQAQPASPAGLPLPSSRVHSCFPPCGSTDVPRHVDAREGTPVVPVWIGRNPCSAKASHAVGRDPRATSEDASSVRVGRRFEDDDRRVG